MTLAEFLEIVVIITALAVIAYAGANTYFKARISRELMEHETPFELQSSDFSKTILVLGDSTGVGVGAEKAEDTVAGRLAIHVGATYVENYAVSGAEVLDLPKQREKARLPRYDYILIQIGGNDIIAFHPAKKTALALGGVLADLPEGRVFLMSAGNVGGGTMLPMVVRPFHTALNLAYHKEFGRIAHAYDATYINLFEPFWKDPFLRDPNRYLSRDGLHPSSYGYGLWFDKLRTITGI